MFDSLPASNHRWIHSMIALQVPKTASTAINSILNNRNLIEKHRQLFEQKYLKNSLFRGTFDIRHVTPQMITEQFGDKARGYFSFAVVREPQSRLASAYNFGKSQKMWKTYGLDEDITSDEFVSWLYSNRQRKDILILLPQTTWTMSDFFRPTEILLFERLQQDWEAMLDKHHIEGLPRTLPHANKSEGSKQIFSKESIDKIRELYRLDYQCHYPNA